MQQYYWGTRSKRCIESLHPDLQRILNLAITMIPIDVGIHEGHRTEKKQLEYFLKGLSRIDPRIPEQKAKAKHLKMPAEAFDFHCSEKNATWQKESLSFIAGYLMAIADVLFASGEIDHRLRWGGDWDMDGEIIIDQKFDDLPHLELYRP